MRVSKNKTVSELSRRPKKKRAPAIFEMSFLAPVILFSILEWLIVLRLKGGKQETKDLILSTSFVSGSDDDDDDDEVMIRKCSLNQLKF